MNSIMYNLSTFPQLCQSGIHCDNTQCNYTHIFQTLNLQATQCNYNKNCYNKHCPYSHPKSDFQVKYDQGKSNMLCYALVCMSQYYLMDKSLFDLKHFAINFDSDLKIWNEVKNFKYNGLNHIVVADAFVIKKNSLVLNFGNKMLGGGTLHKGNVQEEQITMMSSLLPFLIQMGDWDGLPIPLKKSLADEPYVIRMNKFGDMRRPIYGTDGVLKANSKEFVKDNMFVFDNPIEFDWLCAAWPRLNKSDGSSYTDINILVKMFMTTYKVFVTGLCAANLDSESGHIRVVIGSMGCGAFNHCVHIAYSILILSLYCAVINVKSSSVVDVIYYTYDQNIYNELNSVNGAVNVLDGLISKQMDSLTNKHMNIEDIIKYIWILCQDKSNDKWRRKH